MRHNGTSHLLISLLLIANRTAFASPPGSASPKASDAEQAQQARPPDRIHFSQKLARELGQLSCFDVVVGGKLGGVVPVETATDVEQAALQHAWERVLTRAVQPSDLATIDWRTVLWASVPWQEPRKGHKDPSPPRTNVTAAKWFVAGSPYVVQGAVYRNRTGTLGVTVSLTGDARVRFTWPRLEDHREGAPGPTIVQDIDKARLLAIMRAAFQIPWNHPDDFVVLWSPSPTSEGHLKIESTHPIRLTDSKAWFDEVWLGIEGDDPQHVSFGFVNLDKN